MNANLVRRLPWLSIVASLWLCPVVARADGSKPAPDPTDRYEQRQVEGWPIRIHKQLVASQPDLTRRTLEELASQLLQIKHRVPAGSVKKLQTVTIWVEEKEPHHPCMAYHPDAGWPREHDMNPDKARCVEIANARNFLVWTREQPWMVFHELAHAYHHQKLDKGFDNPDVRKAYRRGMDAKAYDSVLHWDGKNVRHYACTNPMEFFAEASEALFGTNDFYPFVRAELKHHDPETAKLLVTLWGGDRP